MIQIRKSHGVAHFMADHSGIDGGGKLHVIIPHPFAIDVGCSGKMQSPVVRPQGVCPSSGSTLSHKSNVIHIAIGIAIDIQSGRYAGGNAQNGSPHHCLQANVAIVIGIICRSGRIADGIRGTVGHEIPTIVAILKAADNPSHCGRVESGADYQIAIAFLSEIITHGYTGGAICHAVIDG